MIWDVAPARDGISFFHDRTQFLEGPVKKHSE